MAHLKNTNIEKEKRRGGERNESVQMGKKD